MFLDRRLLCALGLATITVGTVANGHAVAQATLPRPTIHDSAGIRIVEYSSLRGLRPSIPVGAAFLDLGGTQLNAQAEFDSRHPWLSATALASGTIVVNDFSQLKFFDRRGTFLRAVGRRGGGPGEFGQTREVCRLRGDTVLVVDYANGRLTLWDSAGRHVRTFGRPGFVPLDGCRADGTVIVQGDVVNAGSKGSGDATRAYVLAHPDGRVVRRLGALPATAFAGPLTREPSLVPAGDELYVADAKGYEVRVHSIASGRLRRILRVTERPRPVTDAEWRERVEAMVPRNASDAQRARLVARLSGMRPATVPAYRRVRVDPARRVWIEDYDDHRRWTVFDSTGLLLGRLDLPRPERSPALAGIAVDHLVVRWQDGDGASHLSFHRLVVTPPLGR